MVCHFCAMSISCCLIKGSRVLPARSSHSRALARYSSALDVRTDLPVSTFRPLPAEIPAAHRIQVGSLPGPSLAMTGCSGYQPAQLTGENEPGLGGNEKPQLVSSILVLPPQFSLLPVVGTRCSSASYCPHQFDLTLMRKNPATMAAGSLIASVLG